MVGGGGSRGYLCASHSKTSFGPFFFYLSPPHPPPPPKENNNNTSLHLRNTHHPRLFTSQTTCQGHRKVTCHKSTSTGNKVIQVKVGRDATPHMPRSTGSKFKHVKKNPKKPEVSKKKKKMSKSTEGKRRQVAGQPEVKPPHVKVSRR